MKKDLEEIYYFYYNKYINAEINCWQWDLIKETIRKFEYWKTEMEKGKK